MTPVTSKEICFPGMRWTGRWLVQLNNTRLVMMNCVEPTSEVTSSSSQVCRAGTSAGTTAGSTREATWRLSLMKPPTRSTPPGS